MIKKEDIELDYEMGVIEDLKIIDYEMWGVIINKEKTWWMANRVIGFAKIIDSPFAGANLFANSYQRCIEWLPVYLDDDGCLSKFYENEGFIYGEFTQEKLQKFIDTHNPQAGGSFALIGLRSYGALKSQRALTNEERELELIKQQQEVKNGK